LNHKLFSIEQFPSTAVWHNVRDSEKGIADTTYNTVLLVDGLNNRDPWDYWGTCPIIVMQASQSGDLFSMTNALNPANCSSWLYQGHGGPATLLNGNDGLITVAFNSATMGKLRSCKSTAGTVPNQPGHHYWKYNLRNPMFEVWLEGCATAKNQDWAVACGVPPIDFVVAGLSMSFFWGYGADLAYCMSSDQIAFNNTVQNLWTSFINDPIINDANWGLQNYPAILTWQPVFQGSPYTTFAGR
jgi:hypothetical protein